MQTAPTTPVQTNGSFVRRKEWSMCQWIGHLIRTSEPSIFFIHIVIKQTIKHAVVRSFDQHIFRVTVPT